MDVIYAGRLTTEGWAAEEREGGVKMGLRIGETTQFCLAVGFLYGWQVKLQRLESKLIELKTFNGATRRVMREKNKLNNKGDDKKRGLQRKNRYLSRKWNFEHALFWQSCYRIWIYIPIQNILRADVCDSKKWSIDLKRDLGIFSLMPAGKRSIIF